jgi:protein-tyrosine phosphatase
MKTAFLFTIVGTLAIAYGLQDLTVGWLMCWVGLAYLLVSAAYLGVGPSIFGKKPNGRLSIYAQLALFPYLLITWMVWYALRVFRTEPPYHQVLQDLYVGRRLLSSEYPNGLDSVLDLTCEFNEPKAVVARHRYYSLPILDACGVSDTNVALQLQEIIDEAGVLFIHCAEGHGRTGMVAAVALLLKGVANQPEEAIRFIQNRRPKVRLSHEQMRTVNAVWKSMQKEAV